MKTEMFDYTTVLATLQQIAPEAHIAGGAVRDTILQKQIHDIDVFMKDEHVEEAAALLRSHCSYVKVGEWKQYLGFSDPAMTRVAKFEKADETIPVCIIGLLPSLRARKTTSRASTSASAWPHSTASDDTDGRVQPGREGPHLHAVSRRQSGAVCLLVVPLREDPRAAALGTGGGVLECLPR